MQVASLLIQNSSQQYTSVRSVNMAPPTADFTMHEVYPSTETAHSSPEPLSPIKAQHKEVRFELLLESPQQKGRLPMRVNIFPHDTTDSIITTVKNFFGLYKYRGVVFQDGQGNTLIASYENFTPDMTVYVRVTTGEDEMDEHTSNLHETASSRRTRPDDGDSMMPPTRDHRQASRPSSRPAPRQSHSPQPGRGRRSESASTNNKHRVRTAAKGRATSSHGSFVDPTADGYHSDSDGGGASVTSSRRGKKEQVASAEISVENIVEGGRRKRAKFDSSELPLFIPPQVPMSASISSISPQRRISGQNGASPYSYSNQQTFAFSHSMQSPHSYGQGETAYLQGLATPYTGSNGPQMFRGRTRGSGQYASYGQYGESGTMLPTPDPTLGSASVISDEDVARQLMRLGDASNLPPRPRTSTSPVDDALSRKPEVASSSEGSDDGSDDGHKLPQPYFTGHINGANPQPRGPLDSGDSSGDEYEDREDDSFRGETDDIASRHRQGSVAFPGRKRPTLSVNTEKAGKPRSLSKTKVKHAAPAKQPISPTSLPPPSRKTSSASLHFQHQLGADEEDLSSKPRCQRCRKSKKGCDRQRPCGRCKDAGIGIEGCISEDEGNGRKGRYGRHMGVPVKKSPMDAPPMYGLGQLTGPNTPAPVTISTSEKSKKRKR